MDHRQLRWFLELKSGEAQAVAPSAGQRVCVTYAFLVDPASAGRQSVAASVKTASQEFVLGPLSAEKPRAKLRSAVPLLGEEFRMERSDDGTDAVVRFHGYIPDWAVGDEEAVLADGEEEAASDSEDAAVDAAPPCQRGANLSDEEEETEFDDEDGSEEELYDSDDEESDDEVDDLLQLALRKNFVPEGRFLGPPRYATAGSTAGYMRVTAVESQQGAKQILVLYRYTRFSMAPDGREGVQARGDTREHQARFIVPAAGNTASSLPWAGSLLMPMIYPNRFSKRLQELWSSLVSAVSIPAQATRVQVIVDVGILPSADYTPARMEQVHAALGGMVSVPWPAYHIGMDFHLPEPVLCTGGEVGERPAKRRKIAGQDCPVCFESLESGLAVAWPGCSHVFHGGCLELSLKKSQMCPLCRRTLSEPLDEREAPDK